MALNALESEMVTFTGVPGIEANGITVGYRAEYTPRTSTEIKYQAIEQRTSDVSGGNNLNRGQYYIQLGEQLYDGKLTKRYARDDFERPSINWQYDGKDVGTYVDYELKRAEYTDEATGEELYDLLTFTTIDQNDLLVYTDGVANNTQKTELRRSNKNAVGGSGKGVLTEVFLDEERDEIIVTSINTYLAKANSDYNTTNETLSLRIYTGSNGSGATSTTKVVDSDDVAQAAGVAKDDFKLVYMSGKESAASLTDYARFDVVNIFDTEIMSDSEVTKFSTNSSKVVGKLTTGGTEYDTNVKAYYDFGEVLNQYDQQLLTDNTYNIYLDRYGNVIGVDLHEGTKNYVFITGYDRNRSNISVKTAEAAAIFMDGTMDTITVNVTDTNKNIDSAKNSAREPDAYREYAQWNADGNNANTQGDRNLNRWYTYTQSASGVYTLKPVKNFMFTAYTIPNDGTTRVLDCANLFLDDDSAINTIPTNADKGRVYGEDESVYITVSNGRVDTGNGTDAITDVDGVYTGAQDIKIELDYNSRGTINSDKTAANNLLASAQESVAEQNAYVYTVFDNNNYIIASVVLGEAQGATANYVYVMGDAKNERVERASSSRANDSDTYYWEFDAVVDGVKTTLTVKEKYSTTLQNLLNVHGLVQVRYDGEYVVDIDPVDTTDIYYTYDDGTDGGENTPSGQIEDKDVYDVGNVNGSAWVDDNNGEIQNTLGLRGTNNAFVPERNDIDRVNGTIYLQGRTLYVMNAAGQRDVGLALARDAKAVLIQPEDGEEEATDCTDVQNAIDRLADRDTRDVSAAAGIQFKGRIVAVLDSRGVAQWVVLISDTNLVTGNDPGYNTQNARVQLNTLTGVASLSGLNLNTRVQYVEPATSYTMVLEEGFTASRGAGSVGGSVRCTNTTTNTWVITAPSRGGVLYVDVSAEVRPTDPTMDIYEVNRLLENGNVTINGPWNPGDKLTEELIIPFGRTLTTGTFAGASGTTVSGTGTWTVNGKLTLPDNAGDITYAVNARDMEIGYVAGTIDILNNVTVDRGLVINSSNAVTVNINKADHSSTNRTTVQAGTLSKGSANATININENGTLIVGDSRNPATGTAIVNGVAINNYSGTSLYVYGLLNNVALTIGDASNAGTTVIGGMTDGSGSLTLVNGSLEVLANGNLSPNTVIKTGIVPGFTVKFNANVETNTKVKEEITGTSAGTVDGGTYTAGGAANESTFTSSAPANAPADDILNAIEFLDASVFAGSSLDKLANFISTGLTAEMGSDNKIHIKGTVQSPTSITNEAILQYANTGTLENAKETLKNTWGVDVTATSGWGFVAYGTHLNSGDTARLVLVKYDDGQWKVAGAFADGAIPFNHEVAFGPSGDHESFTVVFDMAAPAAVTPAP